MLDPIYCQQYRGSHLGWRPENDICIQEIENIIYAHTTVVDKVFNDSPKEPFNLVTESGDLGLHDAGDKIVIGSNFCQKWSISKKDIPENLNRWFACHANINHSKIKALPLGTDDTTINKISILKEKNLPKTKLIYLNCRLESNIQERLSAYQAAQQLDWNFSYHPSDRLLFSNLNEQQDDFLYQVATHKFCVCPMGAGVDCYRFWEALYLGSIPIVKKNQVMTQNWNLPILEVENWSDCTEEFLNRQYEVIIERGQNQQYCLEQLTRSYWIKQMKNI
jgi:hypothetical protein